MSPLIVDLVRHGDAVPTAVGGDAQRRLSPRGRDDIAELARVLAADGTRWTHIFVSPLVRARETAAILLQAVEAAPVPEIATWLLPDEDPGDVLVEWEARGLDAGHVLLVSHQPMMGRLASLLTGATVEFRPGSTNRVEFDAQPGRGLGHLTRSIHPGR